MSIIRTCHQSELFKFLQSEIRRPGVNSVEEMIENNFTLYTRRGNDEYLENLNITDIILRMEAIKIENVSDILRQTLSSKFKGAYFGGVNDRASGIAPVEFRTLFHAHNILETIRFNMDQYLYEPINEIIRESRENGILPWFLSNALRKHQLENEYLDMEDGPEILTMDHLAIGFLACLVPMIMSLVAFVCELYHYHIALDVAAFRALLARKFRGLFKEYFHRKFLNEIIPEMCVKSKRLQGPAEHGRIIMVQPKNDSTTHDLAQKI